MRSGSAGATSTIKPIKEGYLIKKGAVVCLRQLLFTNLITVEILECSLVKMKWYNGSALPSFPVFLMCMSRCFENFVGI